MSHRLIAALMIASGSLALPETLAAQTPLFGPAINYDYDWDVLPFSVALGDFNRDGKLDMVVSEFSSDVVSVRMGQGGGLFGESVTYTTGDGPIAVAVADVSSDGKLDLMVVNDYSNTVSVRLGLGGGSFGPVRNYVVGTAPTSIAIGDFNQDGHPDLVVANAESHTISVLLGQGGGLFGVATNYETVASPSSIAVGDVNGDGMPDLVIANGEAHTVSVRLGQGGGTFGAATSYNVESFAQSVAVSDLSGDGTLDLASTIDDHNDTSNVSVMLGLGGGDFGPARKYYAGPYPVFVTAANLSGDDVPDLVVANDNLFGTVSLLVGQGEGKFSPPASYSVGEYPGSIAVGDLDGDNDADLVVANVSSHNVSVLLSEGQVPNPIWSPFGFGIPGQMGVPTLVGSGTLAAGSPGAVMLANAGYMKPSVLFVSLTNTPTPFKGGTLEAVPSLAQFSFAPANYWTLPWDAWPDGIPSGVSLYFQVCVGDDAAVKGVSISNALKATQP